MACTTDWDFSCNHCDNTKKPLDSSIKEYIGKNPCWGHTGYYIFFIGKDGIYKFKTLEINYATTEICSYASAGSKCSPVDCDTGTYQGQSLPSGWPKVGGVWCSPHGCPPQGTDGIDTPWYILVETSIDGVNWNLLATLPFDWVKHSDEYTITADNWIQARFIRIRQPEDVADIALCGYLDHVHMNIPDLTKVSSENVSAAEGSFILNASNSLDGFLGKFWGAPTLYGVTRTEDDISCPDINSAYPWLKYFWASGNHSATWFAGNNKAWNISSITGTITIASFRKLDEGSYTADLVFQYSEDGVTWYDIGTQTVNTDATYNVNITLDTPVYARFFRVFPKPKGWGGGSIPPGWITDAEFTLISEAGGGGGPTAEITSITWWPDYPDGNVPPNTQIKFAEFSVKNTGGAGNITLRVYDAVNGSWHQGAERIDYFASGKIRDYRLTGTTPSHGTIHIAITAFGENETEPSLPDPSQCP